MFATCRCGKVGPLYGATIYPRPGGEEVRGRCSACGRELSVFIPFEKPVTELEPFPPFPEPEPGTEEPVVAPVAAVAPVIEPEAQVDAPAEEPVKVKVKRPRPQPKPTREPKKPAAKGRKARK